MSQACSRAAAEAFTAGIRGLGAGSRSYASRPWDAKNPIAYWNGSNTASAYTERKAPRSNAWLLHPWLPVDIRLPMLVGVLGAAAYIYLERTDTLGSAHRQLQTTWEQSKAQVENTYESLRNAVTGQRPAGQGDAKPVQDDSGAEGEIGRLHHRVQDALKEAADIGQEVVHDAGKAAQDGAIHASRMLRTSLVPMLHCAHL